MTAFGGSKTAFLFIHASYRIHGRGPGPWEASRSYLIQWIGRYFYFCRGSSSYLADSEVCHCCKVHQA